MSACNDYFIDLKSCPYDDLPILEISDYLVHYKKKNPLLFETGNVSIERLWKNADE